MIAFAKVRHPLAAVAGASLLALAACSNNNNAGKANPGQTPSSKPSGRTLAETIAKTSDLSTVAGALRDTGLSDVLDSAGSYTILAPNNAAFAKLGSAGKALSDPGNRAQMAAVLRDHIVPGYLTPADIQSAIDAQHGEAKAKTMGDHQLKFTRDGDRIRVANEDGSTAMIAGSEIKASNGVAIPIDGVLKNLTPSG